MSPPKWLQSHQFQEWRGEACVPQPSPYELLQGHIHTSLQLGGAFSINLSDNIRTPTANNPFQLLRGGV